MSKTKSIFLIISTFLVLVLPGIYIREILRAKAKPNRMTRFSLLVITVLSTASLLAQKDKIAIWLAFASMFQSIIIFILSLKNGMGGFEKIDIGSLAITTIGIVLWQSTQNPNLGLYASIIADLCAMIPTLIKTYKLPRTEVAWFNGMDIIASLISLLLVNSTKLSEYIYPLYLVLVNSIMVILIIRPYLEKRVFHSAYQN